MRGQRVLTILAAGLLMVAAATASYGKSRAPIHVVVTPDTGQQIVARLAGAALKKAGFKTKFVELDGDALTAAMIAGKAHVQPDFPGDDPGLAKALTEKALISLGGRSNNDSDEATVKIIWPGMNAKWPYAVKLLKTMTLGDEIRDALIAEVADGATVDDVAKGWMKANKKVWKTWTSSAKNWMKP